MYSNLRPLLFRIDPERVHAFTLQLIGLAGNMAVSRWLLRRIFPVKSRPVRAFGLDFPNPVGLAAGYDKDAIAWRGLASLGFGHVEIGTVTLRPQPGNEKPRVFRLVEDQAVINRMGFPGKGSDFVLKRIISRGLANVVLGVNIGKNKNTPLDQAASEYAELLIRFSPYADYIAINISSPNTVGLRHLQARNELENLLDMISTTRNKIIHSNAEKSPPILVKLAPDLSDLELEDALNAITASGMDGVIATNTTLDRPSLESNYSKEIGGLSGLPLFSKSLQMVKKIGQLTKNRLPVIGVGGIMSSEQAQLMLDNGAVLVQVYTGLIYSGPGFVSQVIRELRV